MAVKKYLDLNGLDTVAGHVNSRLKTVTTMPITASNKSVRLYIGEDTADYIKGHTYEASTTGYFAWRYESAPGIFSVYYTLSDTPQVGDNVYSYLNDEFEVADTILAIGTQSITFANHTFIRYITGDIIATIWIDITAKGEVNVSIYDSVEDIIDDLPNLKDKDLVASKDDELGTVETILASAVPVGTILPYFGSSGTSVWLLCDGREFSTQQYPLLYLLLGDNHTPDLRELVLRGAGHNGKYVFDSTETDPSTGLAGTQDHNEMQLGTFQDDAMQAHTHSYTHWSDRSADGDNSDHYARYSSGNNTGNASGRTDTTTHDKSFAINYIIRGK